MQKVLLNPVFDDNCKLYLIVGPTGKVYVGQTCQPLRRRWSLHRWHARNGTKNPLCAAIRKYGATSFSIKTILVVPNKEAMNSYESALIAKLNTKAPAGYNLSDGGEGPVGYKHSPEVIARMKETWKKDHPVGPHKGKPHSPEARARISNCQIGEKNRFYGRKHSAETRAKMSIAARNRRAKCIA